MLLINWGKRIVGTDSLSWIDSWYVNCRGLCLVNNGYDFSGCSSVSYFLSACKFDSGVVDLSGCTNLKEFACFASNRKYILGEVNLNLYSIREKKGVDDLSKVKSISLVLADIQENSLMGDCLKSLSSKAKITSILLRRWGNNSLNFINNINDVVRANINSFKIDSQNIEGVTTITDINSLSLLIGLRECVLRKLNLSNLNALSTLRNLTSLTISDSTVTDWSALPSSNDLQDSYLYIGIVNTNLNSLNFLNADNYKITSMSLTNNKISRLQEVQYLKKIQTLDLTQNTIADLSGLNLLIVSNSTTLRTLTLDSNPIGDGCVYEEANIDVLRKLKSAGVTSFSFKNCGLGDLSL